MTNLAQALKSEIARIARKEAKAMTDPIRKSNAVLRTAVAGLKREVAAQKAEVTSLRKQFKQSPSKEPKGEEGSSKRMITAKGIRSMRARLGLSAEQMGLLVGVSGQTVYLWERDKAKPRAAVSAALVRLRAMGKREVTAVLLANKTGA